jgi:D-alanyl-D-alanine carboxypeptidase
LRRALLCIAAIGCVSGGVLPAVAGPSILFEAKSGTVLYAEDAGQAWHPASLTKLMTAYITIKAIKSGELKPDELLTCSEAASKMAPSKLGLKPGQTISADMALRAVVIKSANDMAALLAERLGGSQAGFAKIMNDTARRLGMKDSNFVNPNGLPDDGQITTVRDMALLASAIIRDHPDYAQLFATPTMTYGKAKLASHNRLLQTFRGADGMKTGFICDSGYNIVASATRDGHRLVAVLFGGTSAAARNVKAAAMLEYGFANYQWKMSTANRTLETVVNAPSDTAKPGKMKSQVMNWACGWRPPKELLAAMQAEEQVDTDAKTAGKPQGKPKGWEAQSDAAKKPAKAARAKPKPGATPEATATTEAAGSKVTP